MPQKMKSLHWLYGILGVVSLGSIFYTVFVGDIGIGLEPERKVESQHSIDQLNLDMKRLLSSVSSWKSFCEDPDAYIESAGAHGNFTIRLRQTPGAEELAGLSRITREALARCNRDRRERQAAQFRLCLSVKEAGESQPNWFDETHLFELSVEFRARGSKRIATCEDLKKPGVEVQTYFSAYTERGRKEKTGRVSGGLRLPIESTRVF